MQDCIHRIQQAFLLDVADKALCHKANCQLLGGRRLDANTDRCRQTTASMLPGIRDERVGVVLVTEDSDYPVAQ